MKNLKFEDAVKLTGLASIIISLAATFAPLPSHATEPGAGKKQFVEVGCYAGLGQWVPCNDCEPGTKNCQDNSCDECRGWPYPF